MCSNIDKILMGIKGKSEVEDCLLKSAKCQNMHSTGPSHFTELGHGAYDRKQFKSRPVECLYCDHGKTAKLFSIPS